MCFNNFACFAPLLSNLGPECYCPSVLTATNYFKIGRVLLLHQFEVTSLLIASLLHWLKNLHTIVADAVFCIKLPKSNSTSFTWKLLRLLLIYLDFPFSDVNFKFILYFFRVSSCQFFKIPNFWLLLLFLESWDINLGFKLRLIVADFSKDIIIDININLICFHLIRRPNKGGCLGICVHCWFNLESWKIKF